jgi:hypothetical protein
MVRCALSSARTRTSLLGSFLWAGEPANDDAFVRLES